VELSSDEGKNLPKLIRRGLTDNSEARKLTNSDLNDTSKDIPGKSSFTSKCRIPLFDNAESEWEMDEEWGIHLASPSASAGPSSKKKIKTEKDNGPSVAAPALNPPSTSCVIPSVEVALSDEEDYSFMMNDPWILRDRKKIQF